MLGVTVFCFSLILSATCQDGGIQNPKQVEQINQQRTPTSSHDYANFNAGEEPAPEVDAVSAGLTGSNLKSNYTDQSFSSTMGNFFSGFYHFFDNTVKKRSLDEYEENVQGDQPLSDEDAPGVSLAFVFDSTGSMSDELSQVKVGAKMILSSLLSRKEIDIHNFILVPFKDENGLVTSTTHHREFQQQIDSISVYGGGSCPEHSLTALITALQLARPQSFFYVFTDARPEDDDLFHDVTSLIQEKEAQTVDFVLTGSCGDNDDSIYDDIAGVAQSSVYRLEKNRVEKILDYMNNSLHSDQVKLGSINRPAPPKNTWDNHTVLVDNTLHELTVSLSGRNAGMRVTDPKGISKTESIDFKVDLPNVKTVVVPDPDPGRWNFSIASESDYTMRASGRSDVSFRHGFSTILTGNMDETNLRPLTGARCFLIIQVSDPTAVHNLTRIAVNGLKGSHLTEWELLPHPSVPGTFYVADFTPPADFFNLEMSGFGRDGLPITRVTNTAISSSLPEAPRITMKNKTIAVVKSDLKIHCHVISLVPFTVTWWKNGSSIGEAANYSQTYMVEFRLERVDESDEGVYSCKASNLRGRSEQSTKVIVTGPPPSVTAPNRIVAILGDQVEIPCEVVSDLEVDVTWQQFSSKNRSSGILHTILNGKQHKNRSLIIKNVSVGDEGWFVCSATNRAGSAVARIFLEIRDPLRVSVSPAEVKFTKGDSRKLECTAGGLPKPKLHWRYDSTPISNNTANIHIEEMDGKLNLLIDFLNRQYAGIYSCVATNSENSISAQVELIYFEKPVINAVANSLVVRLLSDATLACVTTGVPKPEIFWKRGDEIIEPDDHYEPTNGILKINQVAASDAGEFTCVSRNSAGSAMDHIGLFVGHPPTFIQKPRNKRIHYGHNTTIFCIVVGSPPPNITWTRLTGVVDRERMLTLPNGALRIISADVDDAGRYVCSAKNQFGQISTEVDVKVTGIDQPKIDKTVELALIRVVPGAGVGIPCGVTLGHPPGRVTWLKDGVVMDSAVVGDDGTLELDELAALSGGNYTCFVENQLGNASRNYVLDVIEGPRVEENLTDFQPEVAVKLGSKIVLPCPVTGNPRPKITWLKQGFPVVLSTHTYQDANGSLVLDKVDESFNGFYECTGTNELGSTSAVVTLQVHVPPKPLNGIVAEEAPKEVVEGYAVVFDCQMYAVPAPNVSWFKDSRPIFPDSIDATSQILRFIASVDDEGFYKCVVSNAVGTASKEFRLNILVPPRIVDPGDEPQVAKAGSSVTLRCGVTGTPTPEVLWRRHGTYLNTNSSDMMLVGVSLVLNNVSEDAGGAYICEAENTAGIAQQTFYLHVTYAPRILDDGNKTSVLAAREGDELSISCAAEASPRPDVGWTKNGTPVHPYAAGIVIRPDNTLVFLQVREEHAGEYRCFANNSEGTAERNYRLEVIIPPSIMTDLPNRIEINEGEMLSLVCPVSASPEPRIQWMKDGQSIGIFNKERGDEPPLRFSLDKRQLLLAEAHPTDSGNYSCVAINSAGRTDASFSVSVLMTPHFEEFNHIARRIILVGGYVSLNCSVSGNPPPQVTWRKDSTPVLPGRPPGVLLSRDQFHLIVPNARLLHTGTYTCAATNKIASKEREFYVTVLAPPKIPGDVLENVDLMLRERLVLECPAAGEPKPQISWYAESCDGTKHALNVTDAHLVIEQVDVNDTAVYSCEAVSTAGTASKNFNVTVLVPPEIDGNGLTDDVVAAEGEDISLKCMVRGQPRPKVTWLHNGVEVESLNKRRRRDLTGVEHDSEMEWILTLNRVDSDSQGLYTALASNRAGVSNKNFRVVVAAKPKVVGALNQTFFAVVGKNAELKCPIEASPPPKITWYPQAHNIDQNRLVLRDDGKELVVLNVTQSEFGLWTCVGENPAGNISANVFLQILEPPWFPEGYTKIIGKIVGEDVAIDCEKNGLPEPKVSWYKNGKMISTTDPPLLKINRLNVSDSGNYVCIAKNIAGAAEKSITLKVFEPPVLSEPVEKEQKIKTLLDSRLEMICPFVGTPTPSFSWYKNEELILDDNSAFFVNGEQLVILSAHPEHSGLYRCVAVNAAGKDGITFQVDVYVPADWSEWSAWSDCSVSCGTGLQFRKRFCNSSVAGFDDEKLLDTSNCVGVDKETRECGPECPVNGGWGLWSDWGECSVTCGSGTRRRFRQCSNPVPVHGGAVCVGPESETEECHKPACINGGKWLPWTDWSPCSATCGRGVSKRTRFCKPNRARPCKDKVEIEVCYAQPCSAALQIKGNLNGEPIDAEIEANLTGSRLEAKLALDREATWFPYAPLLMAPVAWNAASEEDSAANGYSLTRGRFLSQSQVSFDSGEGLAVRTEGRGVNPDGQLTVHIEVAGEAPVFEPSASVKIKSMEQDFVQVGENKLLGLSKDILTSEKLQVPFQVNSTVSYDSEGKMPFLAEKFRIHDIQNDDSGLGFTANSSIAPIAETVCPPGFIHDPQHKHCSDIDECLAEPCAVGKTCVNSWGSFSCVCRDGYTENADSLCVDKNECEELEPRCSHSCTNTDGSFFCFCSAGFTLAPDGTTCLGDDDDDDDDDDEKNDSEATLISCPPGYTKHSPISFVPSCQDIDECTVMPGICGEDGLCLNTPGSFQCLDIACPRGFTRDTATTSCYVECENINCPHGSHIAETVVFQLLTLSSATFRPYEDLLHLAVEENSAVWRQQSRIREGSALRLRTADNQPYLYAAFPLKPKTIYRVVAQVQSLGPRNEILFNTDFVVFVTLNE